MVANRFCPSACRMEFLSCPWPLAQLHRCPNRFRRSWPEPASRADIEAEVRLRLRQPQQCPIPFHAIPGERRHAQLQCRLGSYTFKHPFIEVNPAFPLANFGSCPMQNFSLTFDRKTIWSDSTPVATLFISPPPPSPSAWSTPPPRSPRIEPSFPWDNALSPAR